MLGLAVACTLSLTLPTCDLRLEQRYGCAGDSLRSASTVRVRFYGQTQWGGRDVLMDSAVVRLPPGSRMTAVVRVPDSCTAIYARPVGAAGGEGCESNAAVVNAARFIVPPWRNFAAAGAAADSAKRKERPGGARVGRAGPRRRLP